MARWRISRWVLTHCFEMTSNGGSQNVFQPMCQRSLVSLKRIQLTGLRIEICRRKQAGNDISQLVKRVQRGQSSLHRWAPVVSCRRLSGNPESYIVALARLSLPRPAAAAPAAVANSSKSATTPS